MGKANGLEGRRDVDETLSTVSSDKVETRAKGQKDLLSLIRGDGSKPKKQQISDKGYHTILEGVFRSTKYEIAYYARASKSSRLKAESRLATCASLLRMIVESQVRKFGRETVKAILEHICQSLPTPDGNYCDPLVFDYVRALLHLLEYKAHIENLSSEELQTTIDFCLDLTSDIHQVLDEGNLQLSSSTNKSTNAHKSHSIRLGPTSTQGISGNTVGSSSKDNSQQVAYPQLQSSAAGIVSCLQQLASVPNASVFDRADDILAALFELLQSHSNVNTIQYPAFETINSLISSALTSDIDLALRNIRRFISTVRSFWQMRSAGLKEVLLSILLYAEPLFPLLISKDEALDCSADLSVFVEILRQEYCERRPKDLLLVEDLNLADYSRQRSSSPPLCSMFASIRLGAIKAEEAWSLLHVSAASVMVLDAGPRLAKTDEDGDELAQRPTKRQRVTKQLDELRLLLRSPQRNNRIYGLQLLAFVFEVHIFDKKELLIWLELLRPNLSDEDGTIVAWAIFANSW